MPKVAVSAATSSAELPMTAAPAHQRMAHAGASSPAINLGTWTAANTYTANAYRASGPPWLGVPYDATRHSTTPVGTVTFTFTDAQNAAMSYTIDGVSGTNALTRLPF